MAQRSPSTGRTIAQALVLRLAFCLLLIGITGAVVDCLLSVQSVERRLHSDAVRTARIIADAARIPVWNLDARAIRTFLAHYPLPEEVVSVRIGTQYGDPLYTRVFRLEADPVSISEPITRGGEVIGRVELQTSRAAIREARHEILQLCLLRTVIGVSAVILLTAVFLRFSLAIPLRRLATGMRSLAREQSVEPLPMGPYCDMNSIYVEANAMAEQVASRTAQLRTEIEKHLRTEWELQNYKDHLEAIVQERTVALSQANADLTREVAHRKQAQAEILAIRNWEQQRIGQDLHDSLGQQLTGAQLYSTALRNELETARATAAADKAARIAGLLESTISEIRLICRGLNAIALRGKGLLPAIRQLAKDTQTLSGVNCAVTGDGESLYVADETVASHLYHIVQESVHNAVRHGRATRVTISLHGENGRGCLMVQDNGTGFHPTESDLPDGLGLRTMRYRAEAVRGTLDIGAAPDGGTCVRCTFPTEPEAETRGNDAKFG